MGMHSYIKGFIPPDDKWQTYKTIWDACKEIGIDPPKQVGDFFDWTPPTDHGMMVNIKDCITEGHDTNALIDYWDVDITQLPKDVTVIRFHNSY